MTRRRTASSPAPRPDPARTGVPGPTPSSPTPPDHRSRHDWGRGLFHAFNATWGVLAYHFLVPRGLAIAAIGTLTAAFAAVELVRVRSSSLNAQILTHPFFRRVIRPREHGRVSGAFYFLLGVFLVLVLFPGQAVETGCMVMAFGDPAAFLVGSRLGRIRLGRRRTLEGSLAFLAAAFPAALAFRMLAYPDVPTGWTLAYVGSAAAAGMLAEAFSGPLDDNVTVPLAACGTAAAFAALWP